MTRETIEETAISDKLEEFLNNYLSTDTQDTYTVHAIIAICSQLGELVTSELVLCRICEEILPQLGQCLSVPVPSPSTVSAVMEIVMLLSGILPNLTPDTICRYYLQQSRPKSLSLPDLLTTLSLSGLRSISDDFASGTINVFTLTIFLRLTHACDVT